MTGTPSRTTTAHDGGGIHQSELVDAFLHEFADLPRGCVGRKLQAKLRSEVHEVYMRQSNDGRGRVGVQSPTVIRIIGCICNGYMERKSRVLPREICLSATG